MQEECSQCTGGVMCKRSVRIDRGCNVREECLQCTGGVMCKRSVCSVQGV